MNNVSRIDIYEEVFGVWVYLYYNCNFDNFHVAVKKDLCVEIPVEGDESDMCGGVWSCSTDNGNGFILWIEDIKDSKVIYHESLHLSFGILHSRNVKIDFENQEPLAYYTTFWISKLKEKIGGNNGQS